MIWTALYWVAVLVLLAPLLLALALAWRDERRAKAFASIEEFDRMRVALAPPPTR